MNGIAKRSRTLSNVTTGNIDGFDKANEFAEKINGHVKTNCIFDSASH